MLRELLDHFEASAQLGVLIIEESQFLPLVSEMLKSEGYPAALQCRDVLRNLQKGRSCSFVVTDKLDASLPVYLSASKRLKHRFTVCAASQEQEELQGSEYIVQENDIPREAPRVLVLVQRGVFESLDEQLALSKELPWLASFSAAANGKGIERIPKYHA